ncbi:MAG TPA: hypothetical protein VNF73_00375 [Candidatus Saccharimonadales bacterium]|nr:hypothetical protein [Candidatus Saccharimonadales bacterium]
MGDPRLIDFVYPGDAAPCGVAEAGMPDELTATILDLAGTVRDDLDTFPGRRSDCRQACASWLRVLDTRGILAASVGGEGVDDDLFVGYMLVPLDQRSGYRESDDRVHRHYWLALGENGWLFDPTAHQFDDKGGVAFARYVLDGLPIRPAPEVGT